MDTKPTAEEYPGMAADLETETLRREIADQERLLAHEVEYSNAIAYTRVNRAWLDACRAELAAREA